MNAVTPTTALDREIALHLTARDAGDVAAAWTALERAHILSQPKLGPHLRVHGLMLDYAVRLRKPREIAGQLARLALAPLGALTGRIPKGQHRPGGRERVPAHADPARPRRLHGRRTVSASAAPSARSSIGAARAL